MIRQGFLILALASAPSTSHADVQWSARYGFGLGSPVGPDEDRALLIETTLRSEFLFGSPGDEHVRLGPALELRLQRFDTVETGAGAAVLLPVSRGYPLVLSGLVGYAWRSPPEDDGPFAVATLAWGYRSYNYHSFYGLGLQIYVSARAHLDRQRGWEVTAGVEIDLAALVVIPVRFIVTAFRRSDPDEPDGE